jgi:hypothetical protein
MKTNKQSGNERGAGNVMGEIGGEVPSNGAADTIAYSEPYTATFKIEGVTDLLFRAWNAESVEAKSKAAKGSKAKKTDDLESCVYRNEKGELSIPGEYVRMAIINAAKYRQDPRSPRKSAMDIFKAGLIPLTLLASFGRKQWDYEDTRRVRVQQAGINRTRPAMKAGWTLEFAFQVALPQYITPSLLQDVLVDAGRLIGIADFRPTYGRFHVVSFKTSKSA